MGCRNSTNRDEEAICKESASYGSKSAKNESKKPQFTDEQKHVVRESWKRLQEDISKVGVVTFMRLFEKYPDVQDIFVPFKGKSLEELKNSAKLREHGLQVMGTVDKCISRLDEPQKLEDMLVELGQRHVMFNTKVDYIDLIGPQFILTIKPTLEDYWTLQIEEAWSDFFKLITYIMKEAMMF